MALTISQALAASYNKVLNEKRKPANQWKDLTFMNELEKGGYIKHEDLGLQIECTLDYQRNPGAVILATSLQPVSTSATEILTAAVYDPAEVSVPIVWKKLDEVQNAGDNAKIKFVSALIDNSLDSHDDLLEQYLFATSTNGFLGLLTHIPTSGQGSDGGIDASANTFWRNAQATYTDDTDIEATFTTVWNAASKGSGSNLKPTLMVSDSSTNALFEGTQAALQRYGDQDFKAGAKSIMFKTAKYAFSQYGTTNVYFLNPKNFWLVVSKSFFREKGDTQEFQNANGYISKMYSALQSVTNNKSRLGVAHL